MENTSNALIFIFIIVWCAEFYLFGMQRAALIISRINDIQYQRIGEQLLPEWYPATWVVRISKFGLLIAVFFVVGWKWAISLFALSFLLTSIVPIPYRMLYSKTFRTKVNEIKKIDYNAGQMFEELLDKAGF